MTEPGASLARPGLFVSFEGTEGSGKSTQMRFLVERLRAEGYAVTENQEPGATVIGRQIRRILLDPAHREMAPMTELLLMFASRAQAAREIIEPALARGEIVVSDRFTDSTLAYQGHARGLGTEAVLQAHAFALDGLWPDLTLVIDLDLETALERAHRRNRENDAAATETRIDQQSYGFHQRVAEAYRQLADVEAQRVCLIDGSGTAEAVAERVRATVAPLLARRRAGGESPA